MRLPLLPAVAVTAAAALTGCGTGAAPEQVSTFRTADPARWTATAHALGRGAFVPANVGYGPTGLTLSLPAGGLDGAEVRSTTTAGSGTFRARLRASAAPGSLSAFFLYLHDFATDSSDELDIEIPGGQPYKLMFTVWRRGQHKPAAQRVIPAGFDPSAGFHDYVIDRDGARVAFSVDGRLLFRTDIAPTTRLRPMFNAWYPTWLTPSTPPAGGVMTVARYGYRPR